jgi:hypothetical protein
MPVLLKSNATGLYCGAVSVGGTTQMVCNITDPQMATPVTIINGQIFYSNAPLAPTLVGQPAVFTNSSQPFTTVLPARESGQQPPPQGICTCAQAPASPVPACAQAHASLFLLL